MGTVTGANAPIPAESPPKGGAVLLSLLLPKFAQGEGLHAFCRVCEDMKIAEGRSALLQGRLSAACVKPRL